MRPKFALVAKTREKFKFKTKPSIWPRSENMQRDALTLNKLYEYVWLNLRVHDGGECAMALSKCEAVLRQRRTRQLE